MLSLQAAVLVLAVSGVGETVLIDFSADWCGPCRQMEGTVRKLAARGYPVRKVNIDHDRALAQRFRVRGIPCFVLLVEGREAGRIEGATGLKDLEQLCQSAGVAPAGAEIDRQRGQSPDAGIPFPSVQSEPPLVDVASAPSVQRPRVIQASTAAPSAQPSEDVTSRLLAASVRLKIDDGGSHSVGSGTIIDARSGEALVLTCGHVFRDSQGKGPIVVDMFGAGAPQGLPARLISYDLKSDVGLVTFRLDSPITCVRVAPLSQAVRENEPVINIGCNHGDEPTARESHITAIDKFLGPPNLVAAGQPVQGRSGGGLFTREGMLIGVCNAADPADDEGLYAALASVHAELERMGLAEMCLEAITPADLENAAAPPAMSDEMPSPLAGLPVDRLLRTSTDATGHADGPPANLSPSEAAALTEIRSRSDDAEVICIVRSRSDPEAASEIIILDKASPEFLRQLSTEQQGRR